MGDSSYHSAVYTPASIWSHIRGGTVYFTKEPKRQTTPESGIQSSLHSKSYTSLLARTTDSETGLLVNTLAITPYHGSRDNLELISTHAQSEHCPFVKTHNSVHTMNDLFLDFTCKKSFLIPFRETCRITCIAQAGHIAPHFD